MPFSSAVAAKVYSTGRLLLGFLLPIRFELHLTLRSLMKWEQFEGKPYLSG